MKLKITVLPGDGIGPEVTREAVRILRCVLDLYGYEFRIHRARDRRRRHRSVWNAAAGGDGASLHEEQRRSAGRGGLAEVRSASCRKSALEAGLLGLRKALKGFANLRPAIVYPAIADCSPLRAEIVRGADIMFVRELLGGLYFGEPRGFALAPTRSRIQHHALLGGGDRARRPRRL